ncbi:hypothetical protein OROMI_032766 [Orobanche minor]
MDRSTKSISQEDDEYYSEAVQVATSATLPVVLNAAIKLKLFEIISKSGKLMSPSQIASQLSPKNPDAAAMLDRMLLLLSSYSLFTCDLLQVASEDGTVRHERVYGLSPVGQYFVPDEEGISIAYLAEFFQHKAYIDCWYELGNSVLEGGLAFERVFGMNQHEYAEQDAGFNEMFNKGLTGLTSTTMKHFLRVYEGFQGIETLVDVGGGLGVSLHAITSMYPQIRGINFDLPHVVKDAPSYVGVKHIGGDMFESVPKGDAIFMKGALHWSDDRCVKVLNNCLASLPATGKVIIVDFIVPLKPDTSFSTRIVCQTDNFLMTVLPGGKEHSETEFRSLAKRAGFKDMKVKHRLGYFGIIELFK